MNVYAAGFISLFCIAITPTPAIAAPQVGECLLKEVAAFPDRVHYWCIVNYPGGTSERYLAVESASPLAAHALTIAAQASRKTPVSVRVYFDDDKSKNPPGCRPQDCWRLTGVALSTK